MHCEHVAATQSVCGWQVHVLRFGDEPSARSSMREACSTYLRHMKLAHSKYPSPPQCPYTMPEYLGPAKFSFAHSHAQVEVRRAKWKLPWLRILHVHDNQKKRHPHMDPAKSRFCYHSVTNFTHPQTGSGAGPFDPPSVLRRTCQLHRYPRRPSPLPPAVPASYHTIVVMKQGSMPFIASK
eukprot:1156458-Pelagomonas_calceolata.AAC.13